MVKRGDSKAKLSWPARRRGCGRGGGPARGGPCFTMSKSAGPTAAPVAWLSGAGGEHRGSQATGEV